MSPIVLAEKQTEAINFFHSWSRSNFISTYNVIVISDLGKFDVPKKYLDWGGGGQKNFNSYFEYGLQKFFGGKKNIWGFY